MIKEDIINNKSIIKKNFICDLIIIVALILVLILNQLKIMPYSILRPAIYILCALLIVLLIKTNFSFIKNINKKIYNIILNIILPLFITSILGILIINIYNNIAQTNLFYILLPYNLNSDSKYEIRQIEMSKVEGHTEYIYYIDLKEKKVIKIIENYGISNLKSRDVIKKNISESNNNKLIAIMKKIDKIDYKIKNNGITFDDFVNTRNDYIFSNKNYKEKTIDSSNNDLIKNLEKILKEI